MRDFPQLWRQSSEYDALHVVIQNLLLVAIAAELACYSSFIAPARPSRSSFLIIARKMVAPTISGWELLAGVAALAGLVIHSLLLPSK